MVPQQGLELRLADFLVGAYPQADDEDAVEPARTLRLGELDPECHANRFGLFEVSNPCELLGEHEIAGSVLPQLLLGRSRWIRRHDHGRWYGSSDRDDGRLELSVADEHEPIRQDPDLRRPGPGLLSGVGRGEDDLRDQDGDGLPVDACLERRLEVVRPIMGNDLRRARSTDSAGEPGVRGGQLRPIAVCQPRVSPERGRSRFLGR